LFNLRNSLRNLDNLSKSGGKAIGALAAASRANIQSAKPQDAQLALESV
jgi:hypothetical protein